MNEERLTQILLEPKVSEKATRLADESDQYVFRERGCLEARDKKRCRTFV